VIYSKTSQSGRKLFKSRRPSSATPYFVIAVVALVSLFYVRIFYKVIDLGIHAGDN
jgi:hypothetical protein